MQHPLFALIPHGADFIWIFLIALLLFGSTKLPQLARGLGKSLGEFKKAKEEFEKEIHSATSETETKKIEDKNQIGAPANPTTSELTKKI